jgi:photosystem II stability/assembly factor-like uncharacterized protein
MKKSLLLLLIPLLFSCKEAIDHKPSFASVTADTLLQDEISIRGLTIDGDKVWYAGSNGKYGFVSLSGGKAFTGVIARDTLFPEFRAIAKTANDIFILNAGTPALLYKISKDGRRNKLVYTEEGERVFYDSMLFRNDKEGMAMGDPVNECLSVLTTNDGGNTWHKMPCLRLPDVSEGEAAFAASNTNLEMHGDKVWMVSGGKKSRVFVSEDKGQTWEVHDTPIVQKYESTGIFSVDFYDAEVGFAVGGDFTNAKANKANKMLTEDGGKTWDLMADGAGFGYASCVQFVPGSNANELVTVGPSGIFYSFDRGTTWKKVYDDKSLHTIRFIDNKTAIAAGNNLIVRLQLK